MKFTWKHEGEGFKTLGLEKTNKKECKFFVSHLFMVQAEKHIFQANNGKKEVTNK